MAVSTTKLSADSRIAYIKNGDAVLQLERIGDARPEGGPDAFLADFLTFVEGVPTLLVSKDRRDASSSFGTLSAHVVDVSVDKSAPLRLLGKVRGFVSIFRKLTRFKPRFVICGCLGAPLWASYLAARWCNANFVHSRHVDSVVTGGSRLRGWSYRMNDWVVRRAEAAVCHGPYTRQQLLEVGVAESRLFEFDVGYPAPEDDLSLEDLGHLDLRDKQLVLYVGRVHEDKGVFDLLEASRKLLESDVDRRLVVVGAGPGLEQLKQQIDSTGLTSSVRLVGQVPHEHVSGWLRHASVVVTPTRHAKEGRCLTAMEAMACGSPVIAPDGGPFPFLVEHGSNGLLYEVDSISDLAAQLQLILEDSELRATLAQGAKRSGRRLREPVATFSAALSKAFNVARSLRSSTD